MYVDPLLNVGIVSATNVRIQKKRISTSHVVHVDKLNVCLVETSMSWLSVNEDDVNAITTSGDEMVDEAIQADTTVVGQPDEMVERTRRPPTNGCGRNR